MFVWGALLGGLTTGALVTLVNVLLGGLSPKPIGVVLVAGLLLLSLTQALGWHDTRLPHRARIVPQEQVLGKDPLQGALQFGYEMGTGLRTHMPSNLPYVAVFVGVLLGPWWGGLMAGVGFALGRVIMAAGRWSNDNWEREWQRAQYMHLVVLNLSAVVVLGVMAWPILQP